MLPELAVVGRSNVGKSTLINGLLRKRLARTSAAPGKTRLANVYRVQRGAAAFHLVDLPGYGFARGSREALEAVVREYFGRAGRAGRAGQVGRVGKYSPPVPPALPAPPASVSALLLIDSRHPGLESDRQAWAWLQSTGTRAALVATKVDKLSRAERQRAMKTNEAVFEHPVVPVSAKTGEGLDELWKLIDRLTKPE